MGLHKGQRMQDLFPTAAIRRERSPSALLLGQGECRIGLARG